MKVLVGTAASGGTAVGKAFYLRRDRPETERRSVADGEVELERFIAARDTAAAQLRALHGEASATLGAEEAEIFEIDAMMLEDEDYVDCVADVIRSEKVNAEYAVSVASGRFAAMLVASDNDYLAARAADVADISGRVIGILSGGGRELPVFDEPVILVADDLMPSQTVQLDRKRLLGIATSRGSAGSHTAILARSMGVPAVVALGDDLDASCDGRDIALDGNEGKLFLEPDTETRRRMEERASEEAGARATMRSLVGAENRTRGGRLVEVFANAGGLADIASVLENDAGGIGLLRSEFLYLEKDDYPSEEELFLSYKAIAEAMGGRKVIIRTLDIGADKKVPYFDLSDEENPALGLRAIRLCLERPTLFRTQLRAILRASAYAKVAVMFPMITSMGEMDRIAFLLDEVRTDLEREGIAFDRNIETGIMVETPAAALISDKLASRVDFFSIGTNDLTQYTLAMDRQNAALGAFLDPRHEAVLRLIEMTARSAHDAGIWVGICGELGADLTLTETFLRMGIDEFSVNPASILPLRKKIREAE
jgi:phosphotransferase system enzyme I (PtsI)